MSTKEIRTKKLNRNEARKQMAKIAEHHPANIRFSLHALFEIKKDRLTTVDIFNVIKSPAAKILHEGELENGTYRYRLETKNITTVIAFDSAKSLVVVTAWRK
jgi:hypothetical protein